MGLPGAASRRCEFSLLWPPIFIVNEVSFISFHKIGGLNTPKTCTPVGTLPRFHPNFFFFFTVLPPFPSKATSRGMWESELFFDQEPGDTCEFR